MILAVFAHSHAKRNALVDRNDSIQYLTAAYHLSRTGTFSEDMSPGAVSPGTGREPGYALVLAALMRLDPAMRAVTPACLMQTQGCGTAHYRSVQLLNGVFVGFAGLFVFMAVGVLGGSMRARWIAGVYIWLNYQGAGDAGYVLSDYLALFLVALTSWLTLLAWRRRTPAWSIATGLALAGLCLVKAVFLYYAVLLIAVFLFSCIARVTDAGRVIAALCLALAFGLPVCSWMSRNHAVDRVWELSAGRMAAALSTREALNHMSAADYAASFVYWTRGFGDALARRIFAPEIVRKLDLSNPKGYFLQGQIAQEARIDALMTTQNLSRGAADQRVAHEVIAAIVAQPLIYAATTLPVFYRGIWMDEFIAVGLPCLIWLVWRALRGRKWTLLIALSPCLYNLLIYPMTTLNIPRYQVTALPGLAIAAGFVLPLLWRRVRARIV